MFAKRTRKAALARPAHAASSNRTSATSSIPSSAATETRRSAQTVLSGQGAAAAPSLRAATFVNLA